MPCYVEGGYMDLMNPVPTNKGLAIACRFSAQLSFFHAPKLLFMQCVDRVHCHLFPSAPKEKGEERESQKTGKEDALKKKGTSCCKNCPQKEPSKENTKERYKVGIWVSLVWSECWVLALPKTVPNFILYQNFKDTCSSVLTISCSGWAIIVSLFLCAPQPGVGLKMCY